MTATYTPPDTVANTAAAVVAASNRLKRTSFPEGAWAAAYLTVHLDSESEVDAIAAQWKVAASWNPARTHYSAYVKHGARHRVVVSAIYITSEHLAERPAAETAAA
jgi:hypothetical protein